MTRIRFDGFGLKPSQSLPDDRPKHPSEHRDYDMRFAGRKRKPCAPAWLNVPPDGEVTAQPFRSRVPALSITS